MRPVAFLAAVVVAALLLGQLATCQVIEFTWSPDVGSPEFVLMDQQDNNRVVDDYTLPIADPMELFMTMLWSSFDGDFWINDTSSTTTGSSTEQLTTGSWWCYDRTTKSTTRVFPTPYRSLPAGNNTYEACADPVFGDVYFFSMDFPADGDDSRWPASHPGIQYSEPFFLNVWSIYNENTGFARGTSAAMGMPPGQALHFGAYNGNLYVVVRPNLQEIWRVPVRGPHAGQNATLFATIQTPLDFVHNGGQNGHLGINFMIDEPLQLLVWVIRTTGFASGADNKQVLGWVPLEAGNEAQEVDVTGLGITGDFDVAFHNGRIYLPTPPNDYSGQLFSRMPFPTPEVGGTMTTPRPTDTVNKSLVVSQAEEVFDLNDTSRQLEGVATRYTTPWPGVVPNTNTGVLFSVSYTCDNAGDKSATLLELHVTTAGLPATFHIAKVAELCLAGSNTDPNIYLSSNGGSFNTFSDAMSTACTPGFFNQPGYATADFLIGSYSPNFAPHKKSMCGDTGTARIWGRVQTGGTAAVDAHAPNTTFFEDSCCEFPRGDFSRIEYPPPREVERHVAYSSNQTVVFDGSLFNAGSGEFIGTYDAQEIRYVTLEMGSPLQAGFFEVTLQMLPGQASALPAVQVGPIVFYQRTFSEIFIANAANLSDWTVVATDTHSFYHVLGLTIGLHRDGQRMHVHIGGRPVMSTTLIPPLPAYWTISSLARPADLLQFRRVGQHNALHVEGVDVHPQVPLREQGVVRAPERHNVHDRAV